MQGAYCTCTWPSTAPDHWHKNTVVSQDPAHHKDRKKRGRGKKKSQPPKTCLRKAIETNMELLQEEGREYVSLSWCTNILPVDAWDQILFKSPVKRSMIVSTHHRSSVWLEISPDSASAQHRAQTAGAQIGPEVHWQSWAAAGKQHSQPCFFRDGSRTASAPSCSQARARGRVGIRGRNINNQE